MAGTGPNGEKVPFRESAGLAVGLTPLGGPRRAVPGAAVPLGSRRIRALPQHAAGEALPPTGRRSPPRIARFTWYTCCTCFVYWNGIYSFGEMHRCDRNR